MDGAENGFFDGDGGVDAEVGADWGYVLVERGQWWERHDCRLPWRVEGYVIVEKLSGLWIYGRERHCERLVVGGYANGEVKVRFVMESFFK